MDKFFDQFDFETNFVSSSDTSRDDNNINNLVSPWVLFGLVFVLETSRLILTSLLLAQDASGGGGSYKLEDDPICGVTSGGREECDWDCQPLDLNTNTNIDQDFLGVITIFSEIFFGLPERIFTNPQCLEDCFPEDHCLNTLINDFTSAGGICEGNIFDLGILPTTNNCTFFDWVTIFQPFFDSISSIFPPDFIELVISLLPKIITDGICSEATFSAIINVPACASMLEKSPFVLNTFVYLLLNSCSIFSLFNLGTR